MSITESKSLTGSIEKPESFDWSSNASWRTHFDNNYSFEDNSIDEVLSLKRSFSQLSVLTAEPIDYDCTIGEVNFKPSEYLESQCSCGQSSTNSASVVPVKQLVPEMPKTMNFEDAGLTKVNEFYEKQNPSSFYYVMDMDKGSVNCTPLVANIQSQFYVPNMYDCPTAIYKKEKKGMNAAAVAERTVNKVTSEYFMDV